MDDETPPLSPDIDKIPDEVLSDVISYLRKKGTIELFAQLSLPEGRQFKELKRNLDLSAGSLSRRLDTGQNLGMLRARTDREGGKNKQKYVAIGLGREIADASVRLGIWELNRQLLELKSDLTQRRNRVIRSVQEGGESLDELAPRGISDEDVSVGVEDGE